MLTILTVFGSGLALFAVLTVCAWVLRFLAGRSLRRQMEVRLTELGGPFVPEVLQEDLVEAAQRRVPRYGLTYPATRTRPLRRKVR